MQSKPPPPVTLPLPSLPSLQLGVAAYLAFGLDEPIYAAVLFALILPQVGVLHAGCLVCLLCASCPLLLRRRLLRIRPAPPAAARCHCPALVCPPPYCPPCCCTAPVPQIYAQYKYFLPDPVANDVKYQASAQPFLVFGLLTTGLAVGAHNNAVAGAGAGVAQAAELAASGAAALLGDVATAVGVLAN